MRTTLDIDDDLLHAIKEMARREQSTAGAAASRLLRLALTQRFDHGNALAEPRPLYGFSPLPAGGQVVTDAQVNRLREDEGI